MKLHDATHLSVSVLDSFYGHGNTQKIILDRETVRKIDKFYPRGLSEYLEQKSLEFTQATIITKHLRELVGLKVNTHMSYFQNDLFSGIDCWFTANGKRVGVDLTHTNELENKVARSVARIAEGDKAKGAHSTSKRKVSHVSDSIGKIAIGIPTPIARFAHELNSGCVSFDELLLSIELTPIPGIEKIEFAPLNTKGRNWISRNLTHPSPR